MEQVFIENTKNLPTPEFDRELFRIRKMCESEASTHLDVGGNIYVCSLSSQVSQFTDFQPHEYLLLIHMSSRLMFNNCRP